MPATRSIAARAGAVRVCAGRRRTHGQSTLLGTPARAEPMRGPVANETPPLGIVEHELRDVWA